MYFASLFSSVETFAPGFQMPNGSLDVSSEPLSVFEPSSVVVGMFFVSHCRDAESCYAF